ncbi:hypothetical protein Taro_052442, partial [Colocasia esculenta]|nr:hypothetical protein [Colocasia esculenta]
LLRANGGLHGGVHRAGAWVARWTVGLRALRRGREGGGAPAVDHPGGGAGPPHGFCGSFRSSTGAEGADANDHLIAAMRQLLRRSLDSPRAVAGTPRRRMRGMVTSSWSEDFFPAMAG